jgi:hypothetical protein
MAKKTGKEALAGIKALHAKHNAATKKANKLAKQADKASLDAVKAGRKVVAAVEAFPTKERELYEEKLKKYAI